MLYCAYFTAHILLCIPTSLCILYYAYSSEHDLLCILYCPYFTVHTLLPIIYCVYLRVYRISYTIFAFYLSIYYYAYLQPCAYFSAHALLRILYCANFIAHNLLRNTLYIILRILCIHCWTIFLYFIIFIYCCSLHWSKLWYILSR